ncbi:MAG: adenylosuccinate synthetase [Myxococcaceae bacterium]|nr:MAG: adenylosuccinate synthetase [Myxococcaceae bacterium]
MIREAHVVVDLGCGDQGKGTITDFLVRARGASAVVRFNGGAQAGHNVVTDDGRHHTFSQFGAGSFVPGVETWLTAQVAVQPWAMVVEAEHLARVGVTDAFARTRIAAEAPVITAFHRAANRLRERARGQGRHGSCGMGVGETVRDARALGDEDVLRVRDLLDGARARAKLRRVQERKRAEVAALRAWGAEEAATLDDPAMAEVYAGLLSGFAAAARVVDGAALGEMLRRPGAVVFEGAQGVLLDEGWGFHPHTTWSDCTGENALAALREHGHEGAVTRWGVVRAYATRHGEGPLVTEDPGLTGRLRDAHNRDDGWQGAFRVGCFDAVTTRYAIEACGGVDALAVTCVDRLRGEPEWKVATAYRMGDGSRVRSLAMGERGDLGHQEAMTAALREATAEYRVTTREGDEEAHLAAMEEETGARVALVSTGPGARDKRWR